MFKHVIVPLDGSPGSEQAVPAGARLARCAGARLVLLRVVELGGAGDVHLEPELARPSALAATDAAQELERVAERARAAGVPTETVLERGAAVERILATIERYEGPVVVMRSRGRGGRLRMGLGSVARRIVGGTSAPVFMLPYGRRALPPASRYEPLPQTPLRILVPMDGSLLAEEALPPASALLQALGQPGRAELHLVRVVQLFDAEAPAHYAEAARYLEVVAERVRAELATDARLDGVSADGSEQTRDSGYTVSWSVVFQTEVPFALVQLGLHGLERNGPGFDVVVMTTHGQGGVQRAILGGVTEQVLYLTHLPVLVVRPWAAGAQEAGAEETVTEAACLAPRISAPDASARHVPPPQASWSAMLLAT